MVRTSDDVPVSTISLTEPWRGLPSRVADLIEPELPGISAEILATIAAEVPEYARPLEGSFGLGLQTGVTEALRQFVALIRDPDAGRGTGREVYVGLGQGELRQGRTLDSLQAAYRLGARVAWRRSSAAGRRAGLDPEVLSLLAESMFAYIDELSADSVEGYAQAQSELAGERQRRRRELLNLLLGEPAASEPELRAAAAAAGWTLPITVAPLACEPGQLPRLLRALPGEVLAAVRGGQGCVLLPDPGGPARRAEWDRAAKSIDSVVVIGPAVTLINAGRAAADGPGSSPSAAAADGMRLARSWHLTLIAHAALGAESAGATYVDDHLAEMILTTGIDLVHRLQAELLAPLAGLTSRGRERMTETALAYVQRGGNAVEIAAALHIHPQTARYRIARLREVFGERLDDPDGRFELEIALRGRFSSSSS